MAKRNGFTLIELVVVVMILGILAAVAAPKLLNTSSTATDNGAKQTLAVIRDAIERYAAEHGGKLPGADSSQATFKTDLQPYLRGPFPICPIGVKNASIAMDNNPGVFIADASPAEGWKYRYTTGEFIINSGELSQSDPTISYD